jgi:dihydrofolate synthase/folylpolyglutamate synthase
VATPWRLEDAEAHLLSLELFGMRFGLERMRRLLTVLGSPQERFAAIHVVGTNGKSSTVRMIAALLEAHGVRTGAFLSPHLTSFAERIRIGDADLDDEAFAAAVQRVTAAAAKVDRTLEDDDDRVTQFELVTATAFLELARQEVEVAVVEAGLGGRHDATNVLGAPVVVLTNVGLEHTRWLGPTVLDIAGEKLAVVRPNATLVLGPVDPEVRELAAATGARIVEPEPLEASAALAGYQAQNFVVAAAAARAHLGELDPRLVAEVAGRIQVPGRMQVVSERPLTIYDGAHNPSGVQALAETLPGARPLIAVVSILDDKDAAGMLRALVGKISGAVFTSSRNPRALSPATLASLAEQLGGPPSEIARDPRQAVDRARELAGPDGAVLATGSIYLIADLLSDPARRRASAL